VRLQGWRGVKLGSPVFIGTDALFEASFPSECGSATAL